MPQIDGYEATRKIREFDSLIPIVALTADVFADAQQACLESGMNDVLTKPISAEAMNQTLHKYLRPNSMPNSTS